MDADAIWHKMGPDRVRVTLPRLGEGDVDLSLGRGAAGQHCARLPARTWLGLGLGLGLGLELGFGLGLRPLQDNSGPSPYPEALALRP